MSVKNDGKIRAKRWISIACTAEIFSSIYLRYFERQEMKTKNG